MGRVRECECVSDREDCDCEIHGDGIGICVTGDEILERMRAAWSKSCIDVGHIERKFAMLQTCCTDGISDGRMTGGA